MAIQGIIAGATAGAGLLTGLFQRSSARRLEKRNPRPLTSVNSNILQNQAMANMMANQGMNQSQYNNAFNQQGLGLASSLRAQGLYGRGAFNANSLFRNYGNQVNQLNIADDNARLQNQRLLMNTNTALAQEQQRVWEWNKARPYQEMAQRVANLRSQGSANITGAIGMGAQAGLMGAFGGNNLSNPTQPQAQNASPFMQSGYMF